MLSGPRVVDPSLAAETLLAAGGDSPLTPRETRGAARRPPGRRARWLTSPPPLHLSEGTVRNHLSAAIGKTGARTRAEAVQPGQSTNGWLLGS